MAFQIGQKVVALRTWHQNAAIFNIAVPKKGQIYTVRAICLNASKDAILLEEIVNTRIVTFADTHKQGEPSFYAPWFRPLVEGEVSTAWTTGAPKDSKVWDNRSRRNIKEKA